MQLDPVEGLELEFVGEEDVDLVTHEITPLVEMPLHTEGVRQCQRHLPARLMSHVGGFPVGGLRVVTIEQVALEVGDPARCHEIDVDVVGPEVRRRTEVGVHRALGVGGDDDQASSRGQPVGGGRCVVEHTVGPHVVGEHDAELVVEHPAEVGRTPTEAGHTRDGVGRRAAGHLDAGAHGVVDLGGAIGLDERHGSLDQVERTDEGLLLVAEHVDERVADPDHIEGGSVLPLGECSMVGPFTSHERRRYTEAPHYREAMASPPETATDAHRLPPGASPERYSLTLAPDLDAASFEGSVDIDLELTTPTSELVCNAAELDIATAWVDVGGDRLHAKVHLDDDAERVTFTLDQEVPAGPVVLHVDYTGTLNDKLRGFYRSTFEDADGEERTIAVTQFEATDARRAFPCWDEPEHKAIFSVTLVVADGLLATSNGPELHREPLDDGRVRITFADTMKMSTYLVAFVVGPLEATAAVDVDGVPLRIIHTPGQAHLAPFALEVGAFALRYFADYYGIVYPGDKLDMVAVPDFAFGAMENLGCVIYRETLLLVDPTSATQAELSTVVDVIAHELAHMWFGDLVTMSWWNGIWLNEAFATFMEMKCADAFRPQWQRWMHFGRERTTAFDTDALSRTRPIEYPVHSPEDAEGMFDVLTYQKGSAVVRMLEQYLGEDAFRDGIRRYLQTHQFANTETGDLWDALEAQTGEPVRAMMDLWIFQGGFPLVDVRTDGDALVLEQQVFRYDGSTDDLRRHVPVVLRRDSALERIALIEPDRIDRSQAALVMANAGGHGFYRVHYDEQLQTALVDGLADLAPLERYSVLDDALAFCLRGDIAGSDVLTLVTRLASVPETDLSIWELAVEAIDVLDRVVADEDRARWSSWQVDTLTPIWDHLGATVRDGDDDRTRALRGLIAGQLGVAGSADMIERCRAWFDASTADPGSVDPGLASGALRVMATIADHDLFEQILDRFRHGTTPQEQMRHLYAAARVEDPDVFGRYLDLVRSSEIRSQNLAFACRAALRNPRHGPETWAFVEDNWDQLLDRLPFNSVHRMIEGIEAIDDGDSAQRIESFLDEHPVPNAQIKVAQHIERMWISVRLRRREHQRLVADLP